MPGTDGTGPRGRGAGTGWGRGPCCRGGSRGMGQRLGKMARRSRDASIEERLDRLEQMIAGLAEQKK